MDTSNKKSIKQGRWAQKIKNLKRSKRKDKKEKGKKRIKEQKISRKLYNGEAKTKIKG